MTPLSREQVVNTLPNGDQRNIYSGIFDAFQNTYGRTPTQDELNTVLPAFSTREGNYNTGNALVSQMHDASVNTPDQINARANDANLANAPQYYDQINGLFNSTLGRAPSDVEKQHFGSLLASKQIDPYTLQQFLQQSPEYTQTQDKNFRDQLSGELSTQDSDYYQNKILPAIRSSLLQSGRSTDSSGYAAMLAKAAEDQSTNRANYLSKLSASQYAGREANARTDYTTILDNYYKNQGYNTQRTSDLQDALLKRSNDLTDYNLQKQAYSDYLSRYGKRSNGLGSLIGGGIGAIGGAIAGGPMGASVGYSLGSGLGGYAQSSLG